MQQERSWEVLLQQIKDLDREHKNSGTQTVWATLKLKTDQLKLLDAQEVAKNVVYAKQILFFYKDKPSRLLAHLLKEEPSHRVTPRMKKNYGNISDKIEDRLNIFSEYYEGLFSSTLEVKGKYVTSLLAKIETPTVNASW